MDLLDLLKAKRNKPVNKSAADIILNEQMTSSTSNSNSKQNGERKNVLNVTVAPDTNATKTHPDGMYNFTCITAEENKTIISVIKEAIAFPSEQQGIALAFFSESITYKPRYIINQIIVDFTNNSDNPLDVVAAFISFSRGGSSRRKSAIEKFEQIPKHIKFPLLPYNNNAIYTWKRLYLTVAEIYEKEYQFEKALLSIEKCREFGWDKRVCVERYAEILAKIDVTKAVDYLQCNISSDESLSFLSDMLDNLKAKAARGYKFKPRNTETENNSESEHQLHILASRYLKRES